MHNPTNGPTATLDVRDIGSLWCEHANGADVVLTTSTVSRHLGQARIL
jgi:hypothetical protein